MVIFRGKRRASQFDHGVNFHRIGVVGSHVLIGNRRIGLHNTYHRSVRPALKHAAALRLSDLSTMLFGRTGVGFIHASRCPPARHFLRFYSHCKVCIRDRATIYFMSACHRGGCGPNESRGSPTFTRHCLNRYQRVMGDLHSRPSVLF